jgi:hypothetical protein
MGSLRSLRHRCERTPGLRGPQPAGHRRVGSGGGLRRRGDVGRRRRGRRPEPGDVEFLIGQRILIIRLDERIFVERGLHDRHHRVR